MKIGIVGLGVVGTANKKGFESLDHEVRCHDTKFDTTIKEVENTDITFICVPTPEGIYNKCDTTIVESVIKELNGINYKGIVAIRSSTVPGFTNKMIKRFKKLTIAFVPEFLKERCADEDFTHNHTLLAVGTEDKRVYNKIVKAHGSYPQNKVRLTATEAEVLKYFNNVYAALRVTFANNFFEICEKLNCDYTAIKDAYIKTGKAVDMYLDATPELRGYSGMCLPKDTKAIMNLMEELNINLDLIKAIESDNSKFRKTVFNGMRGEE